MRSDLLQWNHNISIVKGFSLAEDLK